MANFAANAQIHEYSLTRRLLWVFWFLLVLFPLTLAAQQRNLSTSSKKAAALYNKANEYLRARNFSKAIEALNAAKQKDTAFGEAYLKLAGLYKVMGDKEATFRSYRQALRLLPYNPALNGEYYNFAALSHAAGHYQEARRYFELFLQAAPKNAKATNNARAALDHIAFAEEALRNPVPFKPEKLAAPLNNFAMQYFPALTADQRHLLFTGRLGNRPEQDENLFVAVRREDSWSEPVSISPDINTRQNEGAGSISGDGKTLVFASCDRPDSYGSCDLYISYRTGEKWSKPVNLGAVVNGKGWDSQPSLSADGRTLYFASVRAGGQGAEDIWVTTLGPDNLWSEPVNLGAGVNTGGNENSPFIHPSGSTLYLASDGHPGLGNADIFKADRDAQGNWEKPRNLGYPLNTFENENSLFITTDNRTGYYSRQISNKQGQATIELFQFQVPAQWKSKQESIFAQGNVYDAKTKKPLAATVQLYDVATDELVQQVHSDPQRGDYTIVLTEGKQYAMYVSADGYLLKSLSFDYTAKKDFNPLMLDVYLDPLSAGANIVLNNLFFPSNKYTLEAKSKTELNKLVQFLGQHKGVRIQISGHTDDVGEAAFNLDLSRKRAQSVVDYLTQRGVGRSRLTVAGFGESKPVKPNDSEASRQLNRRIELKVL
jgi:OmpA-OmpF porin, OOP family